MRKILVTIQILIIVALAQLACEDREKQFMKEKIAYLEGALTACQRISAETIKNNNDCIAELRSCKNANK